MTSPESRTEMIKPLVIKAAIPAALSVAAYFCAKIISKHSISLQTVLQPDGEDQGDTNLPNGEQSNLQDKIMELEIQIEDLQSREWDSEARFLRYRSLKEKEFVLTEMRNLMMLEKTRAELLLKEISLMEDESKRMGKLVIECSKLMQHIEGLKRENELLQGKALKQKLGIEARDAELLKIRGEIERWDNLVHELEDEIALLKEAVDHLQREKIELFNKLHPEFETGVTREEYGRVLKDLEQLKKEREEEAKKLRYLEWSNACLRQELLRHHEKPKGENSEARVTGECHGWNRTLPGHDIEHCDCITTNGRVHSRRKRLVQKFKRWVEGGKIEQKEKGETETKCIGWHPVLEEAEDQFVPARRSCSSV